ncbi:hypothetical protein C1H46_027565 [Malus baccata]|uniref:Pre-mRNA-processing factor 19 n=1 Tax=Malus baccata TaxID=106549 RepID=A0A540LK86_MALBA|nr:hypothetical protein C1H46_027565 [Malus baccata]
MALRYLSWACAFRSAVFLFLLAAVVTACVTLPIEQFLKDFLIWVKQDLGPWAQIISTLSGQSKKVTSVKFVGQDDLFISGSADKTVRIWQGTDDGNYNCRHILKDHTAERKLDDTGLAVKTSRYVAAWLNGAFGKGAKAGQVAGQIAVGLPISNWVTPVEIEGEY